MKILRNKNLEGVISKKRAFELLGAKLRVKHLIENVEIEISIKLMGDTYNIVIDYADENLKNKYNELEEI